MEAGAGPAWLQGQPKFRRAKIVRTENGSNYRRRGFSLGKGHQRHDLDCVPVAPVMDEHRPMRSRCSSSAIYRGRRHQGLQDRQGRPSGRPRPSVRRGGNLCADLDQADLRHDQHKTVDHGVAQIPSLASGTGAATNAAKPILRLKAGMRKPKVKKTLRWVRARARWLSSGGRTGVAPMSGWTIAHVIAAGGKGGLRKGHRAITRPHVPVHRPLL